MSDEHQGAFDKAISGQAVVLFHSPRSPRAGELDCRGSGRRKVVPARQIRPPKGKGNRSIEKAA